MVSRPRFLLLFLLLSGLVFIRLPSLASAQSTELFLENAACQENPHSEECICAGAGELLFFPKELNIGGTARDTDGDGYSPSKNTGGEWVDHADEGTLYDATELALRSEEGYEVRCALSYFRENQRRLWYFAVALGTALTVISLVWAGVAYMQNSSSGVDLSRSRMMLMRVIIGLVILACSFLVWEGLNSVLFDALDSWTLERDVFYDLR